MGTNVPREEFDSFQNEYRLLQLEVLSLTERLASYDEIVLGFQKECQESKRQLLELQLRNCSSDEEASSIQVALSQLQAGAAAVPALLLKADQKYKVQTEQLRMQILSRESDRVQQFTRITAERDGLSAELAAVRAEAQQKAVAMEAAIEAKREALMLLRQLELAQDEITSLQHKLEAVHRQALNERLHLAATEEERVLLLEQLQFADASTEVARMQRAEETSAREARISHTIEQLRELETAGNHQESPMVALTSELQAARAEAAGTGADLIGVRAEMDRLHRQLLDVQRQALEERVRRASSEKQVQELTQEIEALQALNDQAIQRRKAEALEAEARNRAMEEQRTKIEVDLRCQLQEAHQRCSELQQQLQQAKENNIGDTKALAQIKEERDTARSQLALLQGRIGQSESFVDALRADVKERAEQVALLEQKIAEISSHVPPTVNSFDDSELREAQIATLAALEELRRSHMQLEELETQVTDLKRQICEHKLQYATDATISGLEQELERLIALSEDAMRMRANSDVEREHKIEMLRRTLIQPRKQEEVEILRRRIDDLQQILSHREDQATNTTELQRKLQEAHERHAEATRTIGFLESAIRSLELRARELQDSRDGSSQKFQSEAEELRRQLQSECVSVTRFEEADSSRAQLVKDNAQLRREIERLSTELQRTEFTVEKYLKQEELWRQTESQLVQLRSVTAELQQQLEEAVRRSRRAEEGQLNASQQLREAQSQLVKSEFDRRRASSTLGDLRHELETARSQLVALDGMKLARLTENESLRQRLADLDSELYRANCRIDELQAELAAANASIERIEKARQSENDSHRKRVQEATEQGRKEKDYEVRSLQSRVVDIERIAEHKQLVLQEEISRLRESKAELQRQIDWLENCATRILSTLDQQEQEARQGLAFVEAQERKAVEVVEHTNRRRAETNEWWGSSLSSQLIPQKSTPLLSSTPLQSPRSSPSPTPSTPRSTPRAVVVPRATNGRLSPARPGGQSPRTVAPLRNPSAQWRFEPSAILAPYKSQTYRHAV
eukprot:TRINITY_DN2872_c0_g1_i1.p1 TRINITY_DN2872_c0_g1~~TRINITY_DN2872_c0_g1_i1.p1  ORF type:complete len:1041 (+),score=228.93 TRINITY_DN2872_c0_g1_i1:22-3123(+)